MFQGCKFSRHRAGPARYNFHLHLLSDAPIGLLTQDILHIEITFLTGGGFVSLDESIVLPSVLQAAIVPMINNTISYSASV